jgi:ABC-type branched-subunit amino acid transport system permease subunit
VGVNVQYDQIITMVVGLVAAGGLYAFFRVSRLGMAMRGVVDDPALLSLTGEKPRRIRSASWMLGCSFAALSGLLIGPTFGRDPILLTLLVVQAFGAAAIGAFSSLPLTYVGGIVVGVLSSLTTKWVAGNESLAGLPIAMPFLILFVALLITPTRRLGVRIDRQPRRSAERRTSRSFVVTTVVGLGIFLLAVPSIVDTKLPVYIAGVTYVIVFLSLALLLWTSGQISLSHAVFVALGATTFSHMTTGLGLPWPVALVIAGLAAVPAGAIVAIPAIRLHGVYLALATFGFGLLMERVFFGSGFMFGKAGYRAAPRPDFGFIDGHSDTGFYYIVLTVAVLACIAVVLITRSRMGRFLRALGDAPTALTVHGLSVNLTRLLVFCTAAFMAGVAGALLVSASGQVSGDGFNSLYSLLWPTVLAMCGTALLPSSMLAAFALAVLPAYMPDGFPVYQSMVFGVAAVVAAILVDRQVGGTGERTQDRQRTGPVQDRLAARIAADHRRALTLTGATAR